MLSSLLSSGWKSYCTLLQKYMRMKGEAAADDPLRRDYNHLCFDTLKLNVHILHVVLFTSRQDGDNKDSIIMQNSSFPPLSFTVLLSRPSPHSLRCLDYRRDCISDRRPASSPIEHGVKHMRANQTNAAPGPCSKKQQRSLFIKRVDFHFHPVLPSIAFILPRSSFADIFILVHSIHCSSSLPDLLVDLKHIWS